RQAYHARNTSSVTCTRMTVPRTLPRVSDHPILARPIREERLGRATTAVERAVERRRLAMIARHVAARGMPHGSLDRLEPTGGLVGMGPPDPVGAQVLPCLHLRPEPRTRLRAHRVAEQGVVRLLRREAGHVDQ